MPISRRDGAGPAQGSSFDAVYNDFRGLIACVGVFRAALKKSEMVRMVGSVEIPQKAFLSVLRTGEED